MSEIRSIGGGIERDERARQFIEDAALLSDDTQENSKVIGYVGGPLLGWRDTFGRLPTFDGRSRHG